MKMKIYPVLLFFVLNLTYAFSTEKLQKKDNNNTDKINILTEKVGEIFKQHCSVAGCHKGQYPKNKLNLETDKFFDAIINIQSLQVDTLKLVDTKNPQKSYLLKKIKGEPGIVDSKMPVDAPPLSEEELDRIEKWINSLAVKKGEEEAIKLQESKKKNLKSKS